MEFEELKRVGTLCQTEQRAHPLGLSQEKNAKKSNWQEVSQLVINKHGRGISSTTRGCRETTASSSNGASETRDHRITSPTPLPHSNPATYSFLELKLSIVIGLFILGPGGAL